MTNSDTNPMTRHEAGQTAGADVYPPTITCPSHDCYQAITNPALAGSIAFDAKNDAYVSTWDGNLFKLSQPVGADNEPPELIASGLNVDSQSSVYGLALDGKGCAYVVNDATQDGRSGQLWRVPLNGQESPQMVATGLATRGTTEGLAVDWAGDFAYAIDSDGVLVRVSLHGGPTQAVATNLGPTNGVALDGDSSNAYVVNQVGALWRVPLSAQLGDRLAVPVQVGTTILGGPMALTLDWTGQNAYVATQYGMLWRVPLDGGTPQKAATGLKFTSEVALDQRGNAYITEVDAFTTASRIWRVDGVAASAPAPTIDAPPQDAHTAETVQFNGRAPGARGIIVQDLHRSVVGSTTVVADSWEWVLGENRLGLKPTEGMAGPISRRGLSWEPGTYVLQFVASNDIGYTEPAPLIFTVDG